MAEHIDVVHITQLNRAFLESLQNYQSKQGFCSQRKIWLYWYYAFTGVKCDDEPFFFKVSIIEF
jgi:hypothetical protein